MTHRTIPPFRGDHVGSLIRSPALYEARAARAKLRLVVAVSREIWG